MSGAGGLKKKFGIVVGLMGLCLIELRLIMVGG